MSSENESPKADETNTTPAQSAAAPTQQKSKGPADGKKSFVKRNSSRGGGRDRGGRGRGKRGRRGEREEKEFEEELLKIDRVTRVVKGGRRLRFRATVVIGDRKGRVGFGSDKAVEVPQAIQKAVRVAKKNLIRVSTVNGTIPHEVSLKFKSAKVMIMPAKSGTGIIAGGAMRKIADLAGIEDMLGKNIGTSNKISSGKAMMLALASLKPVQKVSQKSATEGKGGATKKDSKKTTEETNTSTATTNF